MSEPPPIIEKLNLKSQGNGLLAVRSFADPWLQESVNRVLAELPPGKFAAAVDVGADSQGVQVAGVVRLGEHWSVMGIFDKRYSGEWKGHASLRWSNP